MNTLSIPSDCQIVRKSFFFFSLCQQIVGTEIAIKANTVNVCRIYGTFQDTGKHIVGCIFTLVRWNLQAFDYG